MKFKICQLNDSYFPIMDGVAMTAHNYAYWLNTKFAKTSLIAPKINGYKDLENYDVIRFKSIGLPGMKPYKLGVPVVDFRFQSKMRKTQFDLLHVHCPFISGNIGLKISRKQNIPIVSTFHSKYRDDFKKIFNNDLFINRMTKMIVDFYNSVDEVWVPNVSTKLTLQEYGYKGQIDIIPNGSDFEIPGDNQHMLYSRKGFELIQASDEEVILLFVGQHRWEKNVKLILEALKLLKSESIRYKMIFVGEGYALNDMKKLSQNLGISDSVRFMGVITDRLKLKQIYASADLFVFPSIYDNSPLVMQEAAAFRVPSIVIKNSSSAENIIDGLNGFTIDNNSIALANKIKDLITNKDLIKRNGEVARKTIYHSWEKIVEDVYFRYVDIINNHHYKFIKKKIS